MPRDPLVWMEDIVAHGSECMDFVAGVTPADYEGARMLQAAVERKLFIVGEAVTQIRHCDPALAASLPDVRDIVAFRNLLAHGYFALDNSRVLDIAQSSLPELVAAAKTHLT